MKKQISFLMYLLLTAGMFVSCAKQSEDDEESKKDEELVTPSVQIPGYSLSWQDDFTGSTLSTGKWNIHNENRKSAINCEKSVTVSNGILTITSFTESGNHYTGFIDSYKKYEPVYGFFEARIRFYSTAGEWSAFWLQSNTYGNPIGNPAIAGTEIDIIEHRAINKNGADLKGKILSGVHWDGYAASHKNVTSGILSAKANGEDITGEWHVYAVLWDETGYTFYFDGNAFWSTTEGISKTKEYLRLTSEIEDNDWAGNIPTGGYGSFSDSKTKMEVDWVRVWRK